MHLKVTAHNLAFVSVTRRASKPRSLPLLHSLIPTRDVCRDVCKASSAHTALCHRNPPVHSLAHLHSCNTPSHTLGSLLSHTHHTSQPPHIPQPNLISIHIPISLFLVIFTPYHVWASLRYPLPHPPNIHSHRDVGVSTAP